MTGNVLAVCVGFFLAAVTCSIGSRLIWGAGSIDRMLGLIVIGLPVLIVLFGIFYCVAVKIIKRYENVLLGRGHEKTRFQNRTKSVIAIGYAELVIGTLGCSIYFLRLSSASEFVVADILGFFITIFIFISGYLLLNYRRIGFYLSLVSQLLTFVSFNTDNFSYSLTNFLKLHLTLRIQNSSLEINFVSLIFTIILLKNLKNQARPEDKPELVGSGLTE